MLRVTCRGFEFPYGSNSTFAIIQKAKIAKDHKKKNECVHHFHGYIRVIFIQILQTTTYLKFIYYFSEKSELRFSLNFFLSQSHFSVLVVQTSQF